MPWCERCDRSPCVCVHVEPFTSQMPDLKPMFDYLDAMLAHGHDAEEAARILSNVTRGTVDSLKTFGVAANRAGLVEPGRGSSKARRKRRRRRELAKKSRRRNRR